MNAPKLRFKEFTDEWKNIKLQKIISIYKEQSTIENQYPMLTSSKQGLVLQKDYYSNNARITNRSNIGYNVLPYGYITYRNRSDTGFFTFNINLKLKKGLISYFYPVFSLKNSNEYFLVNLLNTKYQFKMYAISEGTSQKVLSIANLKNLKVLYPSLEEQNKIANFLTTVDKKITNLENIITSLENQKKGLLQQIFSQKLRFKDKNGNNYPNWEKKKLEDIAIFLDNKRKPLEQSERIHGKYPYYGASGIIDYINDYIFDEELVLLSEDGANIIDRNYPICYIATGKYWVNNHAHVLKVKSQYVNKFICESLEQLNYTKYNTGTAQPKLNQDVCRKIILSIPCLEEQTKIANFLSTFDRKLENQKAQLEHWKQIKKGLLQQMFV